MVQDRVWLVAESEKEEGCGPALSATPRRRAGLAARWLTGRARLAVLAQEGEGKREPGACWRAGLERGEQAEWARFKQRESFPFSFYFSRF